MTGAILKINKKYHEQEFSHELFISTRQITKT